MKERSSLEDAVNALTPQEKCCLRVLIKTGNYSAVAKAIGISKRTVEDHIGRARKKLCCTNKAMLLKFFEAHAAKMLLE